MAVGSFFILHEFAPLGLTLERIGPFQERVEFFPFTDRAGEPCNYYLLLSANGRGKTHILEVLAAMMGILNQPADKPGPFGFEPLDSGNGRAQLDFRVTYSSHTDTRHTVVLSLLAGLFDSELWYKPWRNDDLLQVHASRWHRLGIIRSPRNTYSWVGRNSRPSSSNDFDVWATELHDWIQSTIGAGLEAFEGSPLTAPTLLYFPASRDIVKLPAAESRSISAPRDWNYRPVHIFRHEGNEWRESLDNLLVWLKWLDDGRFEAALESVNERVFSESKKKLTNVDKNTLTAIIKTDDGQIHRLDQLSSGEKSLLQIFLRLGAHMTQNCIVLIDEVDAHLHVQWRSLIAEQLKHMAQDHYPNLHVFMASHAYEVMDALAIEIEEPGIRKNGYLLETPAEEETTRLISEDARKHYGKGNSDGQPD